MQSLELSTETLESRLLLAGNVRAIVNGAGDLIIRGDAKDNEIAIVAGGSTDQLIVVGLDTTINGDSDTFVADGVTRRVRILMRGGNDRVEIGQGNIASGSSGGVQLDGMLFANLGAGDDTIKIGDQPSPTTLVDVGESAAVRLGTVYVRGQAGNDDVSIRDVTMTGDLRVFDTTGDDTVFVGNIDMEGENCEIDVATCPGEDEICFDGDFTGMDVRVRAGRGVDTLLGEEMLPENARIDGVEIFGPHGE